MFFRLLGLGIPVGSAVVSGGSGQYQSFPPTHRVPWMCLCIDAHTGPWGSSLQVETEAL